MSVSLLIFITICYHCIYTIIFSQCNCGWEHGSFSTLYSIYPAIFSKNWHSCTAHLDLFAAESKRIHDSSLRNDIAFSRMTRLKMHIQSRGWLGCKAYLSKSRTCWMNLAHQTWISPMVKWTKMWVLLTSNHQYLTSVVGIPRTVEPPLLPRNPLEISFWKAYCSWP